VSVILRRASGGIRRQPSGRELIKWDIRPIVAVEGRSYWKGGSGDGVPASPTARGELSAREGNDTLALRAQSLLNVGVVCKVFDRLFRIIGAKLNNALLVSIVPGMLYEFYPDLFGVC